MAITRHECGKIEIAHRISAAPTMVRSRSGGGRFESTPASPGERACSLPGLPSLRLDLNLNRRTMPVRSAGGDHEIASLDGLLAPHGLPDRAARVDGRRCRRAGREPCQGLQGGTAVRPE